MGAEDLRQRRDVVGDAGTRRLVVEAEAQRQFEPCDFIDDEGKFRVWGVSVVDFDDDDDIDVLLSRGSGFTHELWDKRGSECRYSFDTERFEPVNPSSDSGVVVAALGAFGDFDEDGDLDLYLPNGPVTGSIRLQ